MFCDTAHNTYHCSCCIPQDFLLKLLKDLIDKQTWTDEGSVSERMLRSQLLLLACVRNYQPCVQRAERYFREWKSSNGNMRSVPTEHAVQPTNVKGVLYLILPVPHHRH
jgi:hypothetical protein